MDSAENLELQASHELVGMKIRFTSLVRGYSMPPPNYMEASSEVSALKTMLVALLMIYTQSPLTKVKS